jgi:subfamily B ATP-binding cassette protein MsbA
MFKFMLKIWGLARAYRGRMILGVTAGVIAGVIEPLMIATVTFVYGIIFPTSLKEGNPISSGGLTLLPEFVQHWLQWLRESLASNAQQHPGALLALIAAIPLVMLCRGLSSYLNVYMLQWVAVRSIADLRVRLFNHLMSLSAEFLSGTRSGELVSRILSDTSTLQYLLSSATSVIVKDPVTLTGLLIGLFWKQPRITLISLVVMPVCIVPILIYNRKVRKAARSLQSNTADLSSVLTESFNSSRVIKAYNLENTVVGQFKRTAADFCGHYMRIIRASEIPGPLLEFFGSVGISLVLLYLMSQGSSRPEGSGFLFVILSIFSMYRPLKNLTRLYNSVEQARAASERVFDLLATRNSVPEPAQPKPLKAAGAEIRFDRIQFSYSDKQVIRDLSLRIAPGQLVALVGTSGSGKTTLTNLLLRFYDPQGGSVSIGGVDVRDISTRALRDQIAVVTQETVLFNDTIEGNIRLGRPNATDEEIRQAARHAFAYDFIMEKPEGFKTLIGERGSLLSGGQRQRLAIARAILKDAPILILDEATSSLDTEAEREVQTALESLMQGRTTICIAHRFSTIQKADVIVAMDQGRIVESGTHAQLMDLNGLYRRLYELQFSTAEAE